MITSIVHAAPLRVLLVEDDASMSKLYVRLLERQEHVVGIAPDGLAALRLFREDRWDVIVTDRSMPNMDGEALIREIRGLSPAIPIVMITGLPTAPCCKEADVVLRKPFRPAELDEAIAHALTRAPQRLPSARPAPIRLSSAAR